jgi:hypothetical protein
MTAINLYFQRQHASDPKSDQLVYRIHGKDDEMLDYSKAGVGTQKSPTVMTDRPLMTDDAMLDLSNAITGKEETEVIVGHKDSIVESKPGRVPTFQNEQEFANMLQRLQSRDKLPVLLRVYSGDDPFNTDAGQDAIDPHAVTVLSYTPGEPAMVEVDNSWGSLNDHLGARAVPLHQLYLATLMEGSQEIRDTLTADASAAKSRGNLDAYSALEAIHQDVYAGALYTDPKLVARLDQIISETGDFWTRHNIPADDPSHDNVLNKLDDLLNHIEVGDELKLEKTQYDHHVIDEDQFEDILLLNAKELSNWKSINIDHHPSYTADAVAIFRQGRKNFLQCIADLPADKRAGFMRKLAGDASTFIELQMGPTNFKR